MSNLKTIIIVIIVLLLIAAGVWWHLSQRSREEFSPQSPPPPSEQGEPMGKVLNMRIESPAFLNNTDIPSKYTCDGTNVNPPLRFSDVPEGTKGLVLIVDDPDAPVGTWVHWTVWNIAPETTDLAENSVPDGAIEGVTDFGKPGYGGPCPPSGTHRYFFKVYALDITLGLDSSAKVEDIEGAMKGHILAQAQLMGLYQRQ